MLERNYVILNVFKRKIKIEELLKKKIEIICSFCNITPIFINGSIRKSDNLLNNLSNKIKLSELEAYTKNSFWKEWIY